MPLFSQSLPGEEPEEAHSNEGSAQIQTTSDSTAQEELLHQLQDALRQGVLLENKIWSFKMTDWIVGLHAADIDDDGECEILIASRDGLVKAFTLYRALKWEYSLHDDHFSALMVRPSGNKASETEPRVILGQRNGKVLALNKDGDILPDWEYDTGRMIRQIAVSDRESDVIVIGSEDRSVHVLEGATGRLRWKFATRGWTRCVGIFDLDGDGQEEILAGSGDQELYIFDLQGQLLHTFDTTHQIYALAVAPLEMNGPAHIITSSNHKSLSAWRITRSASTGSWSVSLVWQRSPTDEERLFENRVHAICIADLNKDGQAEILAGSEDGHLVVLNRAGELLWKCDFGSCVSRISIVDLDYAGQIEILVGTENNIVSVLQLELVEHLYVDLQRLYRATAPTSNWRQFIEQFSPRAHPLLEDLASKPLQRPPRMELEIARNLVHTQQYEEALIILLRLLQQKVQYCWSQPFQAQGYIWTGFFVPSSEGGTDEFLLGSDRGYIYALNISQAEPVLRWQISLAETERDELCNRVRMISPGPPLSAHEHSIIAVLASQRILLLSASGQLLQEHRLVAQGSWPRNASFSPGDATKPGEIFLATENQGISVWDSALSTQIAHIPISQGIGVALCYDLLGNGTPQIIAGCLKNSVHAYSREGQEIWRFQTQGRVHALHIADVDLDEHAEVIVGCEDRNLYVLDHEGHLKWRYPTGRGVISLDVCNVKLSKDSNISRPPMLKILAGSADGYLYMFDGYGDLIWKQKFPNRVRLVHTRLVQSTGIHELVVGYENQVELLQILDKDELDSLANICWEQLTAQYTDRIPLRQLTMHPDEYLRGEALAILAGIERHEKEDIQCIQRALREDTSLQVRKKLVAAIVNFGRRSTNQVENVRQARQLLERLYRDPAREVRLELVQIFPLLADTGLFFGLFFENLERSTDHADEEVRRSVVRRLDLLLEVYPGYNHKRVFSLLLKTARDTAAWVRQEAGRALAHYFEKHTSDLAADLMALLDLNTDLMILEQITFSSSQPVLKGLFQNIRRQIVEVRPDNLLAILDEAILYLNKIRESGPLYIEEWLQMYEEFRQFARSKTISALAGYRRVTRSDILQGTPLGRAGLVVQVFNTLEEVARKITLYERRQTIGERVTTLIQAQHLIEILRSDLRQAVTSHAPESSEAHAPENRILALLVEQWWEVINKELALISGSAKLTLSLGNTLVARSPEVTISLYIRNDGQCAADNVRVDIDRSADYEIVEQQQQRRAEVSTKSPVSVEFRLRLRKDFARVAFTMTYDDAERKDKQITFADKVQIQDHQRPYHEIINPYTTGTPIRDKEKFYGRTEDLIFLQASLERQSANRVVLLWGQRRMGKTSLIYRLASQLAAGPYSPVFIDFQQHALKENDAQLLESFARRICEQILYYKDTRINEPLPERFASDPSSAFQHYLDSVWHWLPGQRLILLIDEFDDMRQYIARHGDNILRYLRNLMQHYPGLNILLAGAPQMPYMEGYQAILFNIAQSRELGKFKREEAIALIEEPVRADLEYDPLALEKMMAITDGWPYFIHVMGEKLIQHCNALQKSYVTVSEVNEALNIVLDEQETSIRWIWQDLSSPIEKLILSLLAQEKGEEGRVFSLNDIYRSFDAYGILYEQKEVTEALGKLVKGSFVEERFNGTQYCIPVGLIKAWLLKEKPPSRVVREESFFSNDQEDV